MNLSNLTVKLTTHAYDQYCKRVGIIAYGNMLEHLKMRIFTRSYYRSYEYLQIDGVWWCYNVEGDELVIITCYGQSDYDLPLAMRWARKNNDRIDLTKSQAIEILDRGG